MIGDNKEIGRSKVDQRADVKAIKKMPAAPSPERELALFAKPEGNVISKYPKNENANTMKTAKKNRFSQAFVEKLFKTSGEA